MMTNLGAPKRRLVVADVKNPGSANWKTVLPETSDVLSSVQIVNGKLVADNIGGKKLFDSVLRIWLGENAIDDKLKKSMLGL